MKLETICLAIFVIGFASLTHGAPTPEEGACLGQCALNYTYPTRPPVACCGCCDASTGKTCQGNGAAFSTCCQADQDFCGCISSRAYCGGSVYNATYPVESPFGTCYPKGYGTCTYNPSANNWVVCPTGLTGCIGNGIQSCCQAGQTCSFGMCTDTPTVTVAPSTTAASNDCGCLIASDRCCNDLQTGKRCYNPTLYSCTTNDQGQEVLCSAGSASCGDACYSPSQYCCQNGGLQPAGTCGGNPTTADPTTVNPTTVPTSTVPPSSTGSDECGCVIATDECCQDLRTGNRCYNPGEYACTTNEQGQNVLCPGGYASCGSACYSPSQYCCQDGNLQSAGTCNGGNPTTANPTTATPTSPTTAPTITVAPSTSTGSDDCGCLIATDECCNDLQTGKRCYDPTLYSCTTNDQGQEVLCSAGSSSCGDACYSPSQYCCQNGGLQPAGTC